MRIGALHKTTLLDFPGRVSAIVFTQGCNFHCPYCHNPELAQAGAGQGLLPVSDVLSFLERRKRVLQGVVISGGEPAIQPGLAVFCAEIKALGYSVKLDTNGSHPAVLEHLLQQGLVDYVAMDIKSVPGNYPAGLCSVSAAAGVSDSIRVLQAHHVPHEFRLTCAAPFITIPLFPRLLAALPQRSLLFLQAMRSGHMLDAPFFSGQGHALPQEEIVLLQEMAVQGNYVCEIR